MILQDICVRVIHMYHQSNLGKLGIHNMLKLGRNGKKLYNTHSRIDKDCLNGASNFE